MSPEKSEGWKPEVIKMTCPKGHDMPDVKGDWTILLIDALGCPKCEPNDDGSPRMYRTPWARNA